MMVADAAFDPKKVKETKTYKHTRILTRCRFSPCGKFVIGGGLDERLLRWNLETDAQTELLGHQSWLSGLAFHPDQKRLYSTDYHNTLLCWPYAGEQPKPSWSVENAQPGWIRAIAVTPDGKHLLTAGTDRTIYVRSPEDGSITGKFEKHETEVFSLLIHPDGETLVSGDLFGKIHQWEMATGKLVRTLDASVLHTRGEDFLADVGGVRSMAFDFSGECLAVGGLTEIKSNTFCPGTPTILLFDWKSGELKQTLHPQQKSDGPINGIHFLGDGTLIAHAEHLNGNSSLEYWRPDQPQSLHKLVRQSGYDLDLHPDQDRLVVASFERFGNIGNGRRDNLEEYTSNHGALSVFSLQG